MAHLCLSLTARSLDENRRILDNCRPDMAELRVDLLKGESAATIAAFSRVVKTPLILTCRKVCDGGEWDGSDQIRESLLLDCLEGSFDYLDLEEDESSRLLPEKAGVRNCRIIRSIHDFQGVPEDMEERLEAMVPLGDLVKAAVMPRSIADLIRIFQTGMNWDKGNLILLGMGDYGVPTRILASRMNSFLTFCSSAGQKSAAPGHLSLEVLQDVYHCAELNGKTALYGIIGNPVLHTKSPQIHNRGLKETGQNGIYVPFTVDDVPAFFKLAELLDIRGFSVTVPHKQAVMKELDRMSEAVLKIGSCNTVVREGASWAGYNTDAEGFITPLKEKMNSLESLKNLKTAVIGAGGAARAAVYALVREGCDTTIFNRTPSKAESLASDMGCASAPLVDFSNQAPGSFDLIVQTTSSGMEGAAGADNPIPSYQFQGGEFIYDIIYTPPVTALMKKAAEAGCTVLGGWPMLMEQAREQFRLFTGQELPVEMFQ